MKQKAYLETTVVSYLAASPSRDVVVAGHQRITEQFVSAAVVDEAQLMET